EQGMDEFASQPRGGLIVLPDFRTSVYRDRILAAASRNTVHFSTLMAFSMLIGGSELCVRRRSGKLLIFRLTPRGFRRLRLEPTRSCRISSSTAS
ncbi:MAG: hypothetical protein WBV90_14035, partial [Terrimicrobiaceae bacterium]